MVLIARAYAASSVRHPVASSGELVKARYLEDTSRSIEPGEVTRPTAMTG